MILFAHVLKYRKNQTKSKSYEGCPSITNDLAVTSLSKPKEKKLEKKAC